LYVCMSMCVFVLFISTILSLLNLEVDYFFTAFLLVQT
jgi:hypothetical protein